MTQCQNILKFFQPFILALPDMTNVSKKIDYGTAILKGFEYLLKNYEDVFVIGQGLWSPWYVGNSMTGLDKKFGIDRIIDTPVSEAGCTGAAVGAAISGMRPIVVHPRMDFMLYAIDPIVNQAAKWCHMFGGQDNAGLTIRAIINRGGEQGAQHSQALHSWFAHIPGLRVVMPYSVSDARDLLIASVLSKDPVLYIDDRWLYEQEASLEEVKSVCLTDFKPRILRPGDDITVVGIGFSTLLAEKASVEAKKKQISVEVIDIRILNPFDCEVILASVEKTGRLLVVDGGWPNCGFAGEVIASVCERLDVKKLKTPPQRITLPEAPAPSSPELEKIYYPSVEMILAKMTSLF